MNRKLILVTMGVLSLFYARAQGDFAIKTNLLYGIGTLTPNLGAEMGLGQRSTIDLWGAFNPWNLNGNRNNNKKLVHWLIQPEYRWWLCERFNGHYFGAHPFFGMYNISRHKIPLLLERGSENFRYQGNIFGAGISYGYHLMLDKNWNIQFNIGLGFGVMNYTKYECPKCGAEIGKFTRYYFGPTKMGISLVYVFNKR